MRYQIDRFNHNQTCIQIHFDVCLTEVSVEHWEQGQDIPEWGKNILAIPGIEQVFVKPYYLQVHKAILFKWEDIIPLIVHAVRIHFRPSEEVEEVKETVKPLRERGRPHKVYLEELRDE